ncbi:MAG: OmpA family protein [Firmicutes bacterium]|nr:OmpA family protein [Bacillota bacterium]
MRKLLNKKPPASGGAPEWMTTYGDMVTLLLCFFVLLYSYSVIDIQKFQQIFASIQMTFLGQEGILDQTPDPNPDVTPVEPDPEENINLTYEAVKEYLRRQGLEATISARLEDRGVILEIRDNILFDSGKADIKPEAEEVLRKVAGIIRSVPNQIIVEGHTDNVPINTPQYPSNWELSVDRAVRVVRYLISRYHIAPERFLATGYGEYHPVADNSTAEGRARNRRVNIVISNVNLLDKEAGANE